MSRTKRIPIARQPALQISARAVELFGAMEQAERRRNIADCIDDDSGSGSGYCKLACAHCNEWHRLYAELDHELHLKPWEWPVIELNPFAPGSERSKREGLSVERAEPLSLSASKNQHNMLPNRDHQSVEVSGNDQSDLAARHRKQRAVLVGL